MVAPAKYHPVQYTLTHSATYDHAASVESADTIVVVGETPPQLLSLPCREERLTQLHCEKIAVQ